MSMGVPSLADPFSRMVFSQDSAWTQLLSDPKARHGFLETRSRNSLVTDSAAAASAWGSGQAVNNGVLNVLPNGTHLTPLAALLKDRNKRVGLVTTDKITGATPSGFAVSQSSRSDYFDIPPQFLNRVDVLLGGGRKHFGADAQPGQADLLGKFRANGYLQCDDRDQLSALPSADRVIGLFADDTMPFRIDVLNSDTLLASTPNLSDMTLAALDHLTDKDDGFFLMVEGGRVDHAAHSNDAAALLHEQVDFENALDLAIQFASKRDDTLIVATSDHGNANPGLNGMGGAYTKTDESFARLAKVRASFGTIRDRVKEAALTRDPGAAVNEVLEATCGLTTPPKTATMLGDALLQDKLPHELAILQRSWVGVLSQVLGNHTGIGFTGTNHTADRVMITAIGPGADQFAGIRRHINVFEIVTGLFGIA